MSDQTAPPQPGQERHHIEEHLHALARETCTIVLDDGPFVYWRSRMRMIATEQDRQLQRELNERYWAFAEATGIPARDQAAIAYFDLLAEIATRFHQEHRWGKLQQLLSEVAERGVELYLPAGHDCYQWRLY